MNYTVDLEQIGSRGSILMETNFGLALVIDFKKTIPSFPSLARRAGRTETLDNAITLLSFCHQAAFSNGGTTGAPLWHCAVCKKPLTIPVEYMEKSYPELTGSAIEILVASSNVGTFEAIFVADALAELINELWSKIAAGRRTREILSEAKYSVTIEL